MSNRGPSRQSSSELLRYARSYLEGCRVKLLAVLILDAILTSITGIGLLLIIPLLGLLGLAPGGADNPIWSRLGATLDRMGIVLTLENGLALFAAVICLRALLNWRRETWQVEVEQQFQTALRNRLYETLARTELYCLQRLRTSEFVQATQGEIRRVQDAVNTFFQLSSTVLRLGVYFAVAVVLSREMTLFALVCGAGALLLMRPLVTRTHALSLQQVRVRSSMINNLVEHIQGMRTARSLGLTARFVDDYRAKSNQAARIAVRLARLSARSTLAFEVLAALLLAAMVYVGLKGFSVEPARFLVLLLVFIRVFPTIGSFQNQLQRLVGLVPSFRHYLDLLGQLERHEELASLDESRPRLLLRRALELENVTFRYHETQDPVLRDVTLRVEKGSITVLGGHSGAGKSTLVDVATGLVPPGTGRLLLDGQPLDDLGRIAWRRETALVPQESFLFNDSVRANLLCVRPDASEQQLWSVLDAVNGREFLVARPKGLDEVVGERGVLLSGGERQRISIARALLRQPQLLVLDEPTNNLDADSVAALLEVLDGLRRQLTLLVVSHDRRILERATRVIWLANGTVVAGSTADA